jgi:hypothetical protein
MKGLALSMGVVLAAALMAPLACAQCYYPPIPQAPDMCGPGSYCRGRCGMVYGPNYCVRPPYPPFQGMIPGPPPPRPGGVQGPYGGNAMGPPGSPLFPTHPYARGPRDFFMYYDKDEPSYLIR